ncbi:hypothetical protein ACFL6G_06455 [candidate division KSB1 bacterium]
MSSKRQLKAVIRVLIDKPQGCAECSEIPSLPLINVKKGVVNVYGEIDSHYRITPVAQRYDLNERRNKKQGKFKKKFEDILDEAKNKKDGEVSEKDHVDLKY